MCVRDCLGAEALTCTRHLDGAGRMAKGRPQWVEAVSKSDRLETISAEGETTGRGEALALALAEGAKARTAASTAAAIVKDQWQPSSPAQARHASCPLILSFSFSCFSHTLLNSRRDTCEPPPMACGLRPPRAAHYRNMKREQPLHAGIRVWGVKDLTLNPRVL